MAIGIGACPFEDNQITDFRFGAARISILAKVPGLINSSINNCIIEEVSGITV